MMKADKTALILIEFQNDFCKEGGKLFSLVAGEIERNKTIEMRNASLIERAKRELKLFIVLLSLTVSGL